MKQLDNKQDNVIIAYTGSASLSNGKPNSKCAWACKLMYQGKQLKKSCSIIGKTNNQMAIISILEALKIIKDKTIPVIVYSNSQYVIKILNGDSSIASNAELWKLIMEEKSKFLDIKFEWIKRYGENIHNNEINAIAIEEAKSINFR